MKKYKKNPQNDDKIIIALVPMKAHSERIPNKNIRNLDGKPLYSYILDSLIKSKYIKKIYIDTDSIIISERAPKLSNKIQIIQRPDILKGDSVSMNEIIRHDLSLIDEKYFLQTHSTNPLLTAKTINKAIETFFKKNKKYDSLFSVNKFQSRFYDSNMKAINHDPKKLIRTQDLPPIYEENSNLYIFSKDSFKKKYKRIGNNPYLFEIKKMESLDIDTEEDFKLAEIIKKMNIIN